jgi:8-oxo-dGTP pyrophosphatase MutT (NUDIX family)
VHIWVWGQDGGVFLLWNQRGHQKDSFPGLLDATVGGHLGAGETPEDAWREVEEEIGISIDPAALRHIGTRAASRSHMPGAIDRELQEVFLLRDERPLAAYHPNPAELDGLVRTALADVQALLTGERGAIIAQRLRPANHAIEPVTLRQQDFIPTDEDDYFLRVIRAVERSLAGSADVALDP